MIKQYELDKIKLFGAHFILGDYEICVTGLDIKYRSWHPNKEYCIKYKNVDIYGFRILFVPSGCGAVIISNFNINFNINSTTIYDKEELTQIVNTIFKLYRNDGAGTILTTYGAKYRGSHNYNYLLELGFTVISTYKNWRHTGAEQDLLQLIVT